MGHTITVRLDDTHISKEITKGRDEASGESHLQSGTFGLKEELAEHYASGIK
jgi:hypothetical protein